MPIRELKNNHSARDSYFFSISGLEVRMEAKDSKQDNDSSSATMDENSSMMLVAAVLVTCRLVTTMRQKPNRLAAVLSICWDVLLGI
jgi:hypothetical protein